MIKTIIAAALATTMATSAVAAAPSGEAQTMQIEVADLDLSTAKGQKTLAKRIDRAAREVCSMGEQRTGSRINRSESRQCYRQAKAAATEQFAAVVEDARRGG